MGSTYVLADWQDVMIAHWQDTLSHWWDAMLAHWQDVMVHRWDVMIAHCKMCLFGMS